MTPRAAPDASELVAHLGWVQRLARALVRDVATADDLAQEAARVTLERQRGSSAFASGLAMRSWLRGVVRRLAIDRFRSEHTRVARERQVAARESQPDTLDVVARGARQQQVARAVMELAEPYRSTVLYRYLDELPTREVAARTGVSEELVRKRLERGLAQLRERLDREFGSETRSWALALLGWPGVAAVTTKAKVAVAAVLVLGAAVTWRTLDTSPPSGSQAVATTHAPADPAATNRPAPAHDASPAISREVQPARAPATLATSPTASACVLRVRVVDPAGEPCTEGRIFGFASETTGSTFPPLRSFDQAIAGEVTTLEFPRATRRLLIAASVHGRRPSHRQGASWPDGLWESPAPRIERDLTIEVDRPLEGAMLAGRVLVDGALRTPRGLAIDPTDWATAEDLERDAELYVRIHALDAAYELGPRPSRAFKLWVTSDETVPRLLPIAADLATLDLELSTARTLELTVLDRKSGEPIPDLELHVALNVPVERPSLFRQVWRDHARFVVTDERGIATVTGIPPEGQLDVRRDASASTEKMRVGDQVFQTPRLREPLLELRLESKLPEVIQRTIRVDREDRRPTIHGRVAAVLLESKLVDEPALEVRWARVNEGERADLHDEFVPIDASGEFALTVDAHHEYRIWAEREGIRFTQTAALAVGAEDPEPVELLPRRCDEVLLRLVRCPSEGFVHLFVPDAESVIPRGIVFPVKGGIVERRLALDGPATISVGWQLSRGGESGKVRSIDVNPASMPVVEVDLQGDQTREVRLDLGGVAAPAQSQLVLKAAHELTTSGSMISLRFEGTKGVAPIVVDPGRYLAILAGLPGLAVEEITIPEGPRGAPLTIAFQLKEHPRAELGAGVELTRVGTIELDANFRKALTLRFARRTELAALDTIWLPANCAFTVLPE